MKDLSEDPNNLPPEALAIKKEYELKKLYRRDICPNPDFCNKEHNLWGQEDHHYGCICNGCMAYYQRVLK